MSKRKTVEQFIKESRVVHGNKYDYSKVEYINNSTNVCIVCPKHGEFWQTPNTHLQGRGCKKCGREICGEKLKKPDSFLEKATKKYGNKFSYDKCNYISAYNKVVITCKKHGDFLVTPHDHMKGNGGCPFCKKEKISSLYLSSTEDFIDKSKQIHGARYDYSKVKYNGAHTKVTIICPKHGEFEQTPNAHLNGAGCKKCKMSHLEAEIFNLLSNNGIPFKYDERSLKCLNGLTLDFYIKEYNLGIECQGIQHFMDYKLYRCGEVIKRDNIKRKLCEDNGIKLLYYSTLNIEYPYEVITDKNKLLEIIKNYAKQKLD